MRGAVAISQVEVGGVDILLLGEWRAVERGSRRRTSSQKRYAPRRASRKFVVGRHRRSAPAGPQLGGLLRENNDRNFEMCCKQQAGTARDNLELKLDV